MKGHPAGIGNSYRGQIILPGQEDDPRRARSWRPVGEVVAPDGRVAGNAQDDVQLGADLAGEPAEVAKRQVAAPLDLGEGWLVPMRAASSACEHPTSWRTARRSASRWRCLWYFRSISARTSGDGRAFQSSRPMKSSLMKCPPRARLRAGCRPGSEARSPRPVGSSKRPKGTEIILGLTISKNLHTL